MYVTLPNEFHRTETRVRVGDDWRMPPRASRDAAKRLCSSPECECGKVRGYTHSASEGRLEVHVRYTEDGRMYYQLDEML